MRVAQHLFVADLIFSARHNKLDASGISAPLIDNLRMTQLFSAASTQPLGPLHLGRMSHVEDSN